MRIRVVDAFTDEPFRGNPAAVCLVESWPDEGWMQRVAAEMNLSETAFAHPVSGGEADYALRWFTPLVETDLCGHATLATAHALRCDRGGPATVKFSTRSGILVAHSFDDGSVTLDFPAATVSAAGAPDGLAEALGAEPVAVHRTGALGDLLVVLSDEDTVRGLRPDLSSIARIEEDYGVRGVIVTAQATGQSTTGQPAGYDFVSRFFAPRDGIPEDPVTGSAHTALAPYWAQRLGRTSLVGVQASKRSGVVRTEVHGDRVHLTGHAITVLDGFLQIDSSAVAGSVSGGPAGHQVPASSR